MLETIFGGAHGALIGAWREAGYGLRGTRIGEASNPGPRRVRKFQPVGEDVVTSDSEDTPFVGAVVSAPSTSRAHHCRVGIKVRDDIRKRMRLTSDRQTRVSEATPGESIDDTLLDALELDLSGPGTGSDVPQGPVRINATQVDSDEEPLMRFAVTQQDAPHLCAGPSRQLSPGHGSFPRAGHRRGLVKEVAMSSGPNVITCVVAADEAFQGPTWVDSDDESMDHEPLVTTAEGTTFPIVDSESDLRARAIRGRFESPPASAVQGSGVFGGVTKRDRPESQVSAPSRIRMGQNRFEVLGEEDEQDFEMSPMETTTERLLLGEQMFHTLPVSSGAVRHEDSNFPIRRLRLVGGNNVSQSTTMAQVADPGMGVSHDTVVEDTMLDEEGSSEAHTETIDGASVGDEEPNGRETTVTVDVTPDFPILGWYRIRILPLGLIESLDEVDLVSIFNRRANVMRSIPHVLKGPYVSAVRIAIREALEARVGGNELKLTRACKFFLLFPHMLLFRPSRGGKIPKPQLLERFAKFQRGQWSELVEEGAILAEEAHSVCCRKRRMQKADVPRRAHRALRCVLDGELSAARQALEGAEIGPGTEKTHKALTNQLKRPSEPRSRLPDWVRTHEPEEPVVLDGEEFVKSLRNSRRGAAPGPSGMCAEHLRPLLDRESDVMAITMFANSEALAQGARPNRPNPEEEIVDTVANQGWQRPTSVLLEKNSLDELRRQLTEPERVLMLSQGGPMAAEPFSSFPTSRETRFAQPAPQ